MATRKVAPQEPVTVAEKVEKPQEEPAALALRESFKAFHDGTLDRVTITDDDRASVALIGERLSTFIDAAQRAWPLLSGSPVHAPSNAPEVVTSLSGAVERYLVACTGTTKIELPGGMLIDSPAIESPAVRSALARRGDEIVSQIDDAISAAYARLAKRREERVMFRARVAFWLKFPLVRALLFSLQEIRLYADAKETEQTANFMRQAALSKGVVESLRAVQLYLGNEYEYETGKKAPEPLYGHQYREWLPLVEPMLNEYTADDHTNGGNAA